MKEKDYILASNVAHVRDAIACLRGVTGSLLTLTTEEEKLFARSNKSLHELFDELHKRLTIKGK